MIGVKADIPDFRRQMKEVGEKMSKRVVRAGLKAGADVLKKEAQSRAPVLRNLISKRRTPGLLKSSIYTGSGRTQDRSTVRYFVAVRSRRRVLKLAAGRAKRKGVAFDAAAVNDPFYWRFLEAGWVPRGPGRKLIGGKRLRALKLKRNIAAGARRYRYPFLDPAFRAGGGAALAAFNRTVESEFTQLARIR